MAPGAAIGASSAPFLSNAAKTKSAKAENPPAGDAATAATVFGRHGRPV
jgi:hypothetical protein